MSVTGFIGRNGLVGWKLVATRPGVMAAEHKLMRAHLLAEPVCQGCGEKNKKRLQVHHVVPLWFNPDQAGTDPTDRFCTLCDSDALNCHLSLGHAMNFAKRFVSNVRAVCASMRKVLWTRKVVLREVVSNTGTPSSPS